MDFSNKTNKVSLVQAFVSMRDGVLKNRLNSVESTLKSLDARIILPGVEIGGLPPLHCNNDTFEQFYRSINSQFDELLPFAVYYCDQNSNSTSGIAMIEMLLKYQLRYSNISQLYNNNGSCSFVRYGIRVKAQELAECLKSMSVIADPDNTSSVPMQMIPSTVCNTFRSLLFSDKFADVIFEITDDSESPPTVTRLFAHKNILASSSVYYDTML